MTLYAILLVYMVTDQRSCEALSHEEMNKHYALPSNHDKHHLHLF